MSTERDSNTPSSSPITIRKLKPDFDEPGKIPRSEIERIVSTCLPGFWFVNPIAIVQSTTESEEAVDVASKRHDNWYRLIQRHRKTTWKKNRQSFDDRMSLAYAYDGVVAIGGVVLPFPWWRDCWRVHIDATKVYSQRPQVNDVLNLGDMNALEDIQAQEVLRILNDESTADDSVHVVFPHLTIRTPKESFLTERVKREGSAWKARLKATIGKERARATPPCVRLGLIIVRESVEVLCRDSILRLLSSEQPESSVPRE